MMALLLLTATDGRIAIVERSTLGISPASAAQLRERLKGVLEAAGLEAVIALDACPDRPCLRALAQSRGSVVVGITLVKSRRGLTVDLEAVDPDVVVLQQTFLLSSDQLERSPEAQVFAQQLHARVVKDTPVVEAPKTLEPVAQVDTPAQWLQPTPAPIAPKVIGGVSAGLGVAAVALLIAGAVVKGRLDSTLSQPVVTTISRAQAQQQADLANGLLAGGGGALGLGLAGGVTALVMGLTAKQP
jgi:hypothetical protein